MSGISLKDRENKRIAILIHNGATIALNDLKESDYPYVFTSISPAFVGNVAFDYRKYIEHFNKVYSDMPERKLTIFDKALCLAMAMENHSVINVSGFTGTKPARLANLKEKVIANTVVDFLHASRYSVRGSLIEGTLDLRVFDDGHKRELKQLKTLLALEFKKVNLDYNACLAILIKLYTKGIIYQSGVDTDLEVKIAGNLRVKENVDAYGIQVSANHSYQEYRKRFRK